MERTDTNLREFILSEMKRRDMSARQFARFVGVGHSTINDFATGIERVPSLDFLSKLADATQTDLAALIYLSFPEVASKTALSADARILAQRIEQLPEPVRDAVKAMIVGQTWKTAKGNEK